MIKLAKHSRTLTLILSLVYACSLTGMGSVFVAIGENIESQFFFPCKGSGCQCDRAGRELPNCRCDHTKDSENSSCCSTSDTSLESNESSCCSVSPEPESSCCGGSENDFSEFTISPLGCGGIEDTQAFSSLKHPLLFIAEEEFKLHYNPQNFLYGNNYSYSLLLPNKLLKIPISLSKI